MGIAQSKLTAQGQVSVPAEVRRRLAVGPGSLLEWEAEDGRIVVRRAGRHSSQDIHKALFKAAPKRRPLRELKAGIGRYLKAKHARD